MRSPDTEGTVQDPEGCPETIAHSVGVSHEPIKPFAVWHMVVSSSSEISSSSSKLSVWSSQYSLIDSIAGGGVDLEEDSDE